ncbi:uncharacterized protein LOC134269076 isoform X2 [Saccostrea cucullata]|uniref:uncharacterized protein LOC134269076 isoform X2 n=1 Tax=Saccostrea cuccullata TaxID=36930 RepID=UPI002ED2BE30
MSLFVIFWGLFVVTTAKDLDSSGVCNVSWVNKKMRLGCCVDFQLVNSDCKPCIGRHGVNCGIPCDFGFFGFGCRQICNCSDRQGCDRHTGCFEKKYTINRNNVRVEITSMEAQSIQGQYLTPISLKDKTMASSSNPVKKQRRTNQEETTDETAQESGYTEIPDYQQLKESRARIEHQYAKLRDS